MNLPNLKYFCMFIGYPRSGHTLLGSIIDAHPDATIAQEVNVLLYIKQEKWNLKEEIFPELIQNSVNWTKPRTWTGYQYWIPNQHNAQRKPNITVIGDKKGGETTFQLLNNPHLATMAYRVFDPYPIKWIHGIRNPFDNVATWKIRRPDQTLDECIDWYVLRAGYNERHIKMYDTFNVSNDQLIQDPEGTITKMIEFLELIPYKEYIEDCASVVYKKPSITRKKIYWSDEQLQRLTDGIKDISFLKHYTWDG